MKIKNDYHKLHYFIEEENVN